MTSKHVRQLPLGLYRITWKASHGGGQSLGVVGMRKNGQRGGKCHDSYEQVNRIRPTEASHALYYR